MPINTPNMAITTMSSIRVKPLLSQRTFILSLYHSLQNHVKHAFAVETVLCIAAMPQK